MASHYFSNLPNIQYRNPLSSSYDSENYVTAKNLFIRTKIRDDVLPDISFLRSYTVEDSERPMDVAEKIYGDPMYDWVVMITSNIINVRTDWPLSSKSLYEYCADKYGGDLNATRFYETREIKDKQGRLVMPGGKKVDKTFTIPHPDNHNITLSGDDLVLGISNFLAETRENENKRNIRLMRREYLIGFVQGMQEELQYVPSSQTRNRELKRAG